MKITCTTSSPPDPERLDRAALAAFFGLAEKWQLSTEEARRLLGAPPPSTFFKWKKERKGTVTPDMRERISYLLGIYKALHILLPTQRQADEWIRKPNSAPLFNGQTALERMLAGRVIDLADVRRYLDAERGG